jgi:hypothetical protein
MLTGTSEFFSTEVIRTLGELRMLDAVSVPIDATGNTGVAYLTHRLLHSTETALSERVDNIRRIASSLALADVEHDPESYPKYVEILSSLAVKECRATLERMFGPNQNAQAGLFTQRRYDYELLSAAAYTNKLLIVQKLSKERNNTLVESGTFGHPYSAAALGGSIAAIDHLLQIAHLHGRGANDIWASQLRAACAIGSTKTVEHLLASEWNLRSDFERSFNAIATPDLETFGVLTRFREALTHKVLSQKQLAALLWRASRNDWEEMTAHLLNLGAPTDGEYGGRDSPLFVACQFSSAGVVELLLQHNAETTGHEIAVAAKRGQLGIVKKLVEHGLHVNASHAASWERWAARPPSPIASAVQLEHTELFQFLIKQGAMLTNEVSITASCIARRAGLDSMLALLKEQGC